MSKTAPSTTISRDDLESKLRAFQGDIKGKVDDQKSNLMAAGAGLCVASNYFSQPLLALFAQTFGLTPTHAALLVTVGQLGYLAGLVFLVPLGDRLERRRLLVVCTSLTAIFLAAMGLAPGFGALMAVSVLLGATSVAAQILVPLAAHLAPEARRGRVVSTVMSGLLIGILLARFAAGFVAEVAGWRAVYLVAAVLMAGFAWTCQRRLPRVAPTAQGSYGALLLSIVHLFAREPVLRRRGLLGGLCFGAFAAFWTTMAFMLTDRWHWSEARRPHPSCWPTSTAAPWRMPRPTPCWRAYRRRSAWPRICTQASKEPMT